MDLARLKLTIVNQLYYIDGTPDFTPHKLCAGLLPAIQLPVDSVAMQ